MGDHQLSSFPTCNLTWMKFKERTSKVEGVVYCLYKQAAYPDLFSVIISLAVRWPLSAKQNGLSQTRQLATPATEEVHDKLGP